MPDQPSHTRIGLLFVGGCVLVGVLLFVASHIRPSPDRSNMVDTNVTDAAVDNTFTSMDPPPTVPVDLSGYVGKYPSDGSGGTRFLDDPAVRAAVAAAMGSDKKLALFNRFAVETPIVADGDDLRVHACEARNCGNGYTLLIARDGSSAQVCFQDLGGTGDGKAYWYANGALSSRSDACPDSAPVGDPPRSDATPDASDSGVPPKDGVEN